MERDKYVSCPYRTFENRAFWSKAVTTVPLAELDVFGPPKFEINPHDKIATAGSCFAENITRYLAASGFTHFVAEPGPTFLEAYSPGVLKSRNYGVFSARYGNIYTTLQLSQLFRRALGEFFPSDSQWEDSGHFVDPFRPQIEPGGFHSLRELEEDRRYHLKAVRYMMSTLDVFIFTLGLTEAFVALEDGAVFPLCPGCGVGQFDPLKYRFVNQDYNSVLEHLEQALLLLKGVNPSARIILTVSPVPLVATAENRHVVQSTMYSKSVLRAVSGVVASRYDWVEYFPSYDLIASHVSQGQYFQSDLRSVSEEGIAHVMRMFFRHFAKEPVGSGNAISADDSVTATSADVSSLRLAVACEEELLEVAKTGEKSI